MVRRSGRNGLRADRLRRFTWRPTTITAFHMPVAGTLRAAWFVPGNLFSVNAITAAAVPGLFAKNERVVCVFEDGPRAFAMVLGWRAVCRQHRYGLAW